jgi:hypothetical protein
MLEEHERKKIYIVAGHRFVEAIYVEIKNLKRNKFCQKNPANHHTSSKTAQRFFVPAQRFRVLAQNHTN